MLNPSESILRASLSKIIPSLSNLSVSKLILKPSKTILRAYFQNIK